MKVKINRVRGGSMGDQRNYGLVTGSIWNYENKKDNNNVSTTLSAVPRDEATIEAEKGETVVGDLDNDGMVEHAKIGGKRHSQGGTPLDVPDGSFVFSDYRGLLIKNKDLLKGIFNMSSNKAVTPAKVAQRYEINKYKALLNDPDSDAMTKKTAQLMIDNNMKKLGQLALVQEGMKGFPDGIPAIALPLLGSDFQQQGPQKMKKGGIVKYKKEKLHKYQGKDRSQVGYNDMNRNIPLNIPAPEPITTIQYPQGYPTAYPTQNVNQGMMYETPNYRIPGTNEYRDYELMTALTNPGSALMYGLTPGDDRSLSTYTQDNTNPVADLLDVYGAGKLGIAPYLSAELYKKYLQSINGEDQTTNSNINNEASLDGYARILAGLGIGYYGGKFLNKKAKQLWEKRPSISEEVIPNIVNVMEYLKTIPTINKVGKFLKHPATIIAGSAAALDATDYFDRPSTLPIEVQEVPTTEDDLNFNPEMEAALDSVKNNTRRANAPGQKNSNTNQRVQSSRKTPNGTISSDEYNSDAVDSLYKPYELGGDIIPEMQSKGQFNQYPKEAFIQSSNNIRIKAPTKNYGAFKVQSYDPKLGYYTVYNPQTKAKEALDLEDFVARQQNILKDYDGGLDSWKKQALSSDQTEREKAVGWFQNNYDTYRQSLGYNPYFFGNPKDNPYGKDSKLGIYTWSAPGFEKITEETPAATNSTTEFDTANLEDELTNKIKGFEPPKTYTIGEWFPSDVLGLMTAATAKIPEAKGLYNILTPSRMEPVYINENYEPIAAATQTIEGMGTGPEARASALGVTGKGLKAATDIQQQIGTLNQNQFLQTQAANTQIENQFRLRNAQEASSYMDFLNARNKERAINENAKAANIAQQYGKGYKNAYNQMLTNAMYPYQTQTPWDIKVNPTLKSINDDPIAGNSSGRGYNDVLQYYIKLYSNPSYDLTQKEIIELANQSAKGYLNSGRGNVGTNNAIMSPFEV